MYFSLLLLIGAFITVVVVVVLLLLPWPLQHMFAELLIKLKKTPFHQMIYSQISHQNFLLVSFKMKKIKFFTNISEEKKEKISVKLAQGTTIKFGRVALLRPPNRVMSHLARLNLCS